MLLTLIRAPLGGVVVVGVLLQESVLALIGLTLFVVMDVADGGAARRHGQPDDPDRRALDSLIDRMTIAMALFAAGAVDVVFGVLGGLVLLGSAWGLLAAAGTYARSGVVLKAPLWHRAWSLTYFASGALLLTGHRTLATSTAIGATGLFLVCTGALVQEHRVRAFQLQQ